MKYLLILSTIFLTFACSQPELADPITVDLNGNMKALLNGTDWESGSYNSASVNFLVNKIHVEGYQTVDGVIRNHISLILNETVEGTFNSQSAEGVFYDVQNKRTYISQNDCSLDITEIDIEGKSINGRFSFSGIELNSGESIEILNGEFNNVNLSTVE